MKNLLFIAGPSLLLACLSLIGCAGPPDPQPSQVVDPAPPDDATEQTTDPYFQDALVTHSKAGPQVITRNVLEDRHGQLWLASWNGFLHYDGETFTNVTYANDLKRHRGFSLMEDRDGNLWMGTIGAGVYRYDGASFANFTTADGLVSDVVLSMLQDREGNLWFGGLGATKFDGTGFTTFDDSDGFTSSDVNSISEAPDGSLWFGTRGALFRYDGNEFIDCTAEWELPIGSYIPAIVDREGHVWFGGDRGVYHFDGEGVRRCFEGESYSLMEDSTGHIWFSGSTEASRAGTTILNRFNPKNGLAGRKSYVIENGAIFGLLEDRGGDVWLGTGGGLAKIEGDSVRFL